MKSFGMLNNDQAQKNTKPMPMCLGTKEQVIAIGKEFLAENPNATKEDAVFEIRKQGIKLSSKTIKTYLNNMGFKVLKGKQKKTELTDSQRAELGKCFHQLTGAIK